MFGRRKLQLGKEERQAALLLILKGPVTEIPNSFDLTDTRNIRLKTKERRTLQTARRRQLFDLFGGKGRR